MFSRREKPSALPKEKVIMATHNEKEIKTKWPVTEGTTFGTTKQTGDKYLHAEEGSLVLRKNKKLLGDD